MSEIVDVAQKWAVGRTSYVYWSRLGAYIEEAFRDSQTFLKENGLSWAGTHFTRYRLFTPILVHVEVGIQIDCNVEEVKGKLPHTLKLLQLPSCKALSVWHLGAYESLGDTYKNLCMDIRKRSLYPGRIMFEEYHTNPDVVKDESQYRTRVFWSVSDSLVKSMGLW